MKRPHLHFSNDYEGCIFAVNSNDSTKMINIANDNIMSIQQNFKTEYILYFNRRFVNL